MKKPCAVVLRGVGRAFFTHYDFSEIRMRNWKKCQRAAQTLLEIYWEHRLLFEVFILCDLIRVCWVHCGGDSLLGWRGVKENKLSWLHPCRKLWVFFNKLSEGLLSQLFREIPSSYSQTNDFTRRGRHFPICAASLE